MKIALVSLDQRWEDKAFNLQKCRELTARAVSRGAELIIFPEMTLTGFTMNTRMSAEDAADSFTINAMKNLARENKATVVAGLVLKREDKAVNTLTAVSGAGEELARYYKIHPFSFAGEDKFFLSGDRLAKIQLGELKFGLTICYDLRFPEVYSALGRDCDVIVNIANWPQKRVQHWQTLLRARAIENQCYMIGVNRTGIDGNGHEYERSSAIVNANGEIIQPQITDGELDIYDINRQALLDFRAGFNTRHDRRPQLYREFI